MKNRTRALVEVIREAIVVALAEANGNLAHAASTLMIGRTTLYRKIKDLEIKEGEFMPSPIQRKPLDPDLWEYTQSKSA